MRSRFHLTLHRISPEHSGGPSLCSIVISLTPEFRELFLKAARLSYQHYQTMVGTNTVFAGCATTCYPMRLHRKAS